MRVRVLLGALTFSLGLCCVPKGKLAEATSGVVGCAPDDIEITDDKTSFDPQTWTATCAGKTYLCSRPNGAAPTQCAERQGQK